MDDSYSSIGMYSEHVGLETVISTVSMYKTTYAEVTKEQLSGAGIDNYAQWVDFCTTMVSEITSVLAMDNYLQEDVTIDMPDQLFPYQSDDIGNIVYRLSGEGMSLYWLDKRVPFPELHYLRGWHEPDEETPAGAPTLTFETFRQYSMASPGGGWRADGPFLDDREWDMLVGIDVEWAAKWMAGTESEWEERP